MDMDARRAAVRQRMESLLADACGAGELGDSGMAGPWVLVAETYGTDGERLISTFRNDDNRLCEALGLIRFADVVYTEGVRDWYRVADS